MNSFSKTLIFTFSYMSQKQRHMWMLPERENYLSKYHSKQSLGIKSQLAYSSHLADTFIKVTIT